MPICGCHKNGKLSISGWDHVNRLRDCINLNHEHRRDNIIFTSKRMAIIIYQMSAYTLLAEYKESLDCRVHASTNMSMMTVSLY